jgi:autotransporter-associated beta strand protein
MKTCYRAFIALESRTCNLSAGRPMVVLGLLAGALMLSCPGTMLSQTTFNWTNNASGNWSDTINWMNGQVGDGAGNTAIFTLNITANRTVTLDTNRTLGVIQMSDTSANQVWTLAGTNTLTMDNGLSKAGVRAPSTPVTISVVIAGGTNGIKCPDQAGTMTLSASNAWTGDTEIDRGPLKYGHVNAIPSGPGRGNVWITATNGNPGQAGKLDINTFDPTINGLFSESAAGFGTPSVTSSGSGAGTNTLTVGANDVSSTFGGVIQNGATRSVGLTKTGAGTLTLTNANTYTGPTTVNGGTLLVSSGGGLTGTASVTVNSGGTLGGGGLISGAVTVNAGGSISAGTSPGTLTLANGLDLSAGGTNVWELGANSTANAGTDFDQLFLVGGTLVLGGSSELLIKFVSPATAPDISNPFWQQTNQWTIIALDTGVSNPGPTTFSAIRGANNTAGVFTTAADGSGNIVLTYTPTNTPHAPAPVLSSLLPGAGSASVKVTFSSVSGTNYQVQYKNDLTNGTWNVLSNLTATGPSTTITDSTSPAPARRFYRVRIP